MWLNARNWKFKRKKKSWRKRQPKENAQILSTMWVVKKHYLIRPCFLPSLFRYFNVSSLNTLGVQTFVVKDLRDFRKCCTLKIIRFWFFFPQDDYIAETFQTKSKLVIFTIYDVIVWDFFHWCKEWPITIHIFSCVDIGTLICLNYFVIVL